MANSVNDEVASFDSAFEEALKNLSQFNMSRALKSEQKKLLHWFWKVSTGCVVKWLWEKPDTSVIGLHERNLRA